MVRASSPDPAVWTRYPWSASLKAKASRTDSSSSTSRICHAILTLQRKPDFDDRPAARRTGNGQLTSVPLHDILADGQAEADSLRLAAREKRFIDVFQIFRRDPLSHIREGDEHAGSSTGVPFHGDRQIAAVGHRFDRVHGDVQIDLLNVGSRHLYRREIRFQIFFYGDAVLEQIGPEQGQGVVEQGWQIARSQIERPRPELSQMRFQKFVDPRRFTGDEAAP